MTPERKQELRKEFATTIFLYRFEHNYSSEEIADLIIAKLEK
jgi:hypothetical protein